MNKALFTTMAVMVLIGGCSSQRPPTEPLPSVGDWIASAPVFHDGFEDAGELGDLSRWHGTQRQPEENVIELTAEQVRAGMHALKLVAQPYDGLRASKADVYLDGLAFGNGDEVWTEMWVYVVGGADTANLFIWDLEAPGTCILRISCPSPGLRLYFSGPDGDWLKSHLGKWWRGNEFRQVLGEEIPFPKDRWVRLRVYLLLSPDTDGVMKVWQGDDLIIDATGRTLPRADAIYSRLQIGITANGNERDANTVYIDDVSVWDREPGWN